MTTMLRSGLFWVTLALGANIALAHYFDVFEWKLVAWLLLGAHVLSYAWMCLLVYTIAVSLGAGIKSQKR